MMTCQEAVKRLYDYLDQELDNATSVQIEKHLELCRLCCDSFEFEKSMKKLVQDNCTGGKAPGILRDKILELLNK